MSFPGLPRDATRMLKTTYTPLLEFVHDVVGFDPMILVNIGIILVGLFTFLHYVGNFLYRSAQKVCLSTVRVNEEDPLYQHIMRWMTDHQFQNRQFRSVKAISTPKSTWEDGEEAVRTIVEQKFEKDSDALISYRAIAGRTPIRLEPFQGTRIFCHRGKWFLFSHEVNTKTPVVQMPNYQERGNIKLQCFGSSTAPLQSLLEAAQLHDLEKSMTTTIVYRAISNVRDIVRWQKFSARPSRDISTVIFAKEKKQALLEDINEYLHPHTRRWYANHGIPYRRGYLFSGEPGTGKTSLTSALAGVFGLDIYVLSLLDPNLNESQLMRLMSEVPSRCIVLLEDVDAAGLTRPGFTNQDTNRGANLRARNSRHGKSRSAYEDALDAAAGLPMSTQHNQAPAPGVAVSLSGLLNAIDGVSSQEGRILIMTTNSAESLDRALVRPGRVDMHISFELPGREELRELFLSMYTDTPTSKMTDQVAPRDDKSVPSQGWEPEKKDLESMAAQFAEALPEKKLSLAAAQGFLLQYKRQPREACEQAADWADVTWKKLEREDEKRRLD
ncbi:hypothetical protein DTO063F5_897 [Paecilomyces variotii]|nr:hypothetical protein DTO063F5_897 [Paecilomyces variotii]